MRQSATVRDMHEMSIVQALLERVEAEAAARSARAVVRVEVALGALSGVEPELLHSAWELARTPTRCAAADLVLRSVAARWQCSRCGRPLATGERLRCPECGAPARLAAGDEILLERLELEVP
jgi:hydrogenase nickel incorporation protein HypA/HybF